MILLRRILLTLLLAFGAMPRGWAQDPARFAAEIAAFDAADKAHPPEKNGVVFVGSSSIRKMDVAKVFPGLKALNRGFGGSEISDVNHYLEETVLRYEPKLVIFYCGGNDLASNKTPERVEKDFTEFRTRLFQRLPKVKLVVLAVHPSPIRMYLRPQEMDLNGRFEKACDADPHHMAYIGAANDRYLDKSGKPIPSLYLEDGLHMTDAGYVIWRELLTPYIEAVMGKKS